MSSKVVCIHRLNCGMGKHMLILEYSGMFSQSHSSQKERHEDLVIFNMVTGVCFTLPAHTTKGRHRALRNAGRSSTPQGGWQGHLPAVAALGRLWHPAVHSCLSSHSWPKQKSLLRSMRPSGIWPCVKSLSSSLTPLVHFSPATWGSLFLPQTRHTPAPGLCPWLLTLPVTLFP